MKTNRISISSGLIHTGCRTFYLVGVWTLLKSSEEDTRKFKAEEGHDLTSVFKKIILIWGMEYPNITLCNNMSPCRT